MAGGARRLAAKPPARAVCHPDFVDLVSSVEGISTEVRGAVLRGLGGLKPHHEAWGMDGEDIAVLLFTSGTTGDPKAAVLRHKHLVSYILGSVEFMGAGEDEANLVSVPPYHVAGLASLLSSVFAGRRIVQLPQFDADEMNEIDTFILANRGGPGKTYRPGITEPPQAAVTSGDASSDMGKRLLLVDQGFTCRRRTG